MLGDVVASGLGFGHHALLKVACEAQGGLDVGRLRALVASCQQNHHLAPLFLEIHPIAGTVVDPQFRDTFSNRLDIPGVTCRKTLDPDLNARPCANVPQPVEPSDENLRLADLKHTILYPHGYMPSTHGTRDT